MRNLIAILPLVAVLLHSGCASWDETREQIVDPLNRLVHADYPQALLTGDPDQVAGLFSDELREWAVEDAHSMLDPFEFIDRSRCVIHASDPPGDDGSVRTECVLRLDGLKADGLCTFEQDRVITARPAADGWRITAVEIGATREIATGSRFEDQATERGLIAVSRSRGMPDRSGTMQTYLGSSGVAVGDANGDGLDDLLLVSGDRLRLFLNDDGNFTETTAAAGIETPATGECRCAYFGDIDNDGDADLFVGMLEHPNLLFENLGGGRFREVPESESGLCSLGHTSSACFGDFDRDGNLDLVVVNGNNIYLEHPDPPYAAKNGHADFYFKGSGDGRFVEATEEAGLGDTGWALACAASDYDRDGDLDLFVANDLGLDLLYQNQGDGTFRDVAGDAGIIYHGSSMSADFGDLNGDGWPDLYVSGMASNSRWVLNQPGFPLPAPIPIRWLFKGMILDILWEMFHGNRLYLNQGDGTFRDVSLETKSYWLGWAWSSLFLDFDNDGLLDIYGVNGFYTGEQAADT